MNTHTLQSDYHPREEFWNALTHAVGVVFALVLLVLMLVKAAHADLTLFQTVGVVLFGVSLIAMFLSSTIYHVFSNTNAKFILKRIDHSAIFALIAGTYTPILLIGLQTQKAWVLCGLLWLVACVGVVFKVFFIHRFKRLSLFIYLAMGWASVLIARDLYVMLNRKALWLIVAGGLLYSVGAIFYAAKKYRYTHAVWHGFVLVAAVCQALAIYLYVI